MHVSSLYVCAALVFTSVFVILSLNKGVKHSLSLLWLITSHDIIHAEEVSRCQRQ